MKTVDPWAALGDPTRRGILALVASRPSSVSAIAAELPISRPAVSQHLQILLQARLVDVRPQGRERIYEARLEGLEELRGELETFWRRALTNFKRVTETGYQRSKE